MLGTIKNFIFREGIIGTALQKQCTLGIIITFIPHDGTGGTRNEMDTKGITVTSVIGQGAGGTRSKTDTIIITVTCIVG